MHSILNFSTIFKVFIELAVDEATKHIITQNAVKITCNPAKLVELYVSNHVKFSFLVTLIFSNK